MSIRICLIFTQLGCHVEDDIQATEEKDIVQQQKSRVNSKTVQSKARFKLTVFDVTPLLSPLPTHHHRHHHHYMHHHESSSATAEFKSCTL